LTKCGELEDQLYSGMIRNDDELKARAMELCASVQVSDGREKVWRRGDILVGEVTEISPAIEKRRRIYLTPGAYIMAETMGPDARVIGKGAVAAMVLGNRFTQKLAGDGIARARGRVSERLIGEIFEDAARRTASVSKEFTILRTEARQADPKAALMAALVKDCSKSGWRLCDQR
jgi:hypothetical protein